jgi:hypothetical protein
MDHVRTRFGRDAVVRGRLYGRKEREKNSPTANDEEQIP